MFGYSHQVRETKECRSAVVQKLPAKFTNTRLANSAQSLLNRKVSGRGHPDGFRATIITDPTDTFGFGYGVDILECGICKLFARHQSDYCENILCEIDKITSSMAGLELVRTRTIAQGFKKCDFRYKKINSITDTRRNYLRPGENKSPFKPAQGVAVPRIIFCK